MKTSFTKIFAAFGIAAMLLSATPVFAQNTWQGPTGAPPSNNVDAPINVGTTAQTKNGILGAATFVGKKALICDPSCGSIQPVSVIFQSLKFMGGASTLLSNYQGIRVLTNGAIQILDGNQGVGKVLTSDANGVVSWQLPATASSSSPLPPAEPMKMLVGSFDALGASQWIKSIAVSSNGPVAVLGANDAGQAFQDTLGASTATFGSGNFVKAVASNGFLAKGAFFFQDGTQGANKILASDANGRASWKTAAQLGLTGGSGGGGTPATPFEIRYVDNQNPSTNGSGEAFLSCPVTHPLIISGGGNCIGDAQIRASEMVTFGDPSVPGRWRLQCGKASTGNAQDVHRISIVCGGAGVVVANGGWVDLESIMPQQLVAFYDTGMGRIFGLGNANCMNTINGILGDMGIGTVNATQFRTAVYRNGVLADTYLGKCPRNNGNTNVDVGGLPLTLPLVWVTSGINNTSLYLLPREVTLPNLTQTGVPLFYQYDDTGVNQWFTKNYVRDQSAPVTYRFVIQVLQ